MRWFLLILPFLFVSCSQRIKVPINRMVSPEAIGGGADIEYRQTGLSEGRLDFSNNDTDNPLLMGVVTNRATNLAFGAVENVDFFVTVHQESSSLLGMKIQLVGSDNKKRSEGHKLAATFGMGAERDSYGGEYEISLKSDVTDYALIYGYRTSSVVMFYTGVSLSNYSFQGSISGSTGLNSDEISYSAQNIIGWNGGMELGSPSFKLKVEFATQNIEWTNTEKKLFYSMGLALTATF